MKKLKLLLPLLGLLIISSSFTVKPQEKSVEQLKKQIFGDFLGSFILVVDDMLEMPIDVYGTESGGVFTVTEVKNHINGHSYGFTGTVTQSGTDRIADLNVTTPSGTYYYNGLLDY